MNLRPFFCGSILMTTFFAIQPIHAQQVRVEIGPEGQILASFDRGEETFTLEGNDTLILDNVGGGAIHVEAVIENTTLESRIDLEVRIEESGFGALGESYDEPLDPRFTGDFDDILLANSLTRYHVRKVLFDRVEEQPLIEVVEIKDLDLASDPGTVWTGEPEDIFNATVITGILYVRIPISISTMPRYSDTLTIEIFRTQEPPGITAVIGPAGQVLTSFERDGETHTLEGSDSIQFMNEGEGRGILYFAVLVRDTLLDPIVNLDVRFVSTEVEPTGAPFDDPIDPSFMGDLDSILAENSLTRSDVSEVMFDRVDLQPFVEIADFVGLIIGEEAGTVWIGDPENDFFGVNVVIGMLNGIAQVFTWTTQRSEDTLTIRLYKGAEPKPRYNPDLCPPPDGDGRLDACDLLLMVERMRAKTLEEQMLFEVSCDWLDEEPFGVEE